MCGIVGYVGDRDCADVLVDALSKLEYRGYDSAGIAVFEKGTIKVEKCKGRLANLVDKMAVDGKPQGHCGIGHTRFIQFGHDVAHQFDIVRTSCTVMPDGRCHSIR